MDNKLFSDLLERIEGAKKAEAEAAKYVGGLGAIEKKMAELKAAQEALATLAVPPAELVSVAEMLELEILADIEAYRADARFAHGLKVIEARQAAKAELEPRDQARFERLISGDEKVPFGKDRKPAHVTEAVGMIAASLRRKDASLSKEAAMDAAADNLLVQAGFEPDCVNHGFRVAELADAGRKAQQEYGRLHPELFRGRETQRFDGASLDKGQPKPKKGPQGSKRNFAGDPDGLKEALGLPVTQIRQ